MGPGILSAGCRRAALLAALATIAAASGCQAVAGYSARSADPMATSCALPSGDGPQLRIANLLPRSGTYDVCIRPAGGTYARPLYLGGGACTGGLAYANVTAPFAVPAAQVDVKTVPYGSLCTDAGVAELTGVQVGSTPTTLALMGTVDSPTDGSAPMAELAAFPEDPPVASKASVRVLNAAADSPPLVFGMSNSTQLPATLDTPLVPTPIPFGGLLSSGTDLAVTVTPLGYAQLPAVPSYSFVFAEDGTTKAVILFTVTQASGNITAYAIGSRTQSAFPVRALVCQDAQTDTTGLLTSCFVSPLPSISVDVYAADLFGSHPPGSYAARKPATLTALGGRTPDIACITGVMSDADKADIAAAMKGAAPFAYYPTDLNLDTRPDPDTTWGDAPVPAPTTPACADPAVDQSGIAAAEQCLLQCSTTGDASGSIPDLPVCVDGHCLGALAPLLLSTNRADRVCTACLAAILANPSTSIASAEQFCSNDAREAFSGNGNGNAMIVSKLPLQHTDRLVLPSTTVRKDALYAEVEVDQGKTVAFVCAELSRGVQIAGTYYGNYGNGSDADGYHQEQLWQMHRLVPWMGQKAGALPLIVAGDWEAGHGYDASGTVLDGVADAGAPVDMWQNPDVVAALGAPGGAFTLALPSPFQPFCTTCPNAQDSLNQSTNGYLLEGVYMQGFDSNSAIGASAFFKTAVTLSTGPGYLSENFGLNVQIVRPH
jgi:hypothetical protein